MFENKTFCWFCGINAVLLVSLLLVAQLVSFIKYPKWTLEWEESFNNETNSRILWKPYKLGDTEKRYATWQSDARNLRLNGNGHLIIAAQPPPKKFTAANFYPADDPYEWSTSAGLNMIAVDSLLNFTGFKMNASNQVDDGLRFELSVRLPVGNNFHFHASLSLVGETDQRSGSIVFVEMKHRKLYQSISYADPDDASESKLISKTVQLNLTLNVRQFHAYWMEWTRHGVMMGVDGETCQAIHFTDGHELSAGSQFAGEFQNPIKLLQAGRQVKFQLWLDAIKKLNQSHFNSRRIKSTVELDYIRVYRKQ